MYQALDLKIIHGTYGLDVEHFRSLIHGIDNVCKKTFMDASEQYLIYRGIDSSCWNNFD
jgi:hypothetical protein